MKEKAKKKSVKEKPSKAETPILLRHDPEAQKVEVKFEPGRMVFEVGGQKFYMDAGMANFLFGREIGLEFEKLADRMNDDFSSFNTVDFLARFKVANIHLESNDRVARFLGIEEEKLRLWLNDGVSKKWRTQHIGTEEYAALVKKYEKQYFPEIETPKAKPIKLNVKKVADMLDKKMHLNDIATALGYKFRWHEFIGAYHAQLEEIREIQRKRRASEHGVIY